MKIDQVKEKYKDEWVLAKVVKEDAQGCPLEVEPIAHAKSKKILEQKFTQVEDKQVTVVYTGTPKPRL